MTGSGLQIDGESTALCRCLKLTPQNGRSLGLTDHDHDLDFKGVVYRSHGGLITSAVETTPDLSRDGLDIQLVLSSSYLSENDLAKGVYDGARFELWVVDWQQKAAGLLLTRGYFGTVQRQGQRYSVNLEGPVAQLEKKTGRVFQPGCDAELGDHKCRVDLTQSKWRCETRIRSAESTSMELPALTGYATGFFVYGHAMFMSGKLAGFRTAIREDVTKADTRHIGFWESLPLRPDPGDKVEMIVGCDKRLTTCVSRFANAVNFQGMPHMPSDQLLVRAVD